MITSKQRSYLRKLSNGLDPIFQIGKGGISDGMVKQVEEALEARELIKLHVLNNSDISVQDACRQMAKKTRSDEVQVVGGKFTLYKKSRETPKIELP